MHFYFPNLDIFLTAIHKNGLTSSMNFFGALENYLSNVPETLEELDSLPFTKLNFANEDWKVHTDKNMTIKFLTENEFVGTSKTSSIAIIRDPAERFRSFWFNKILLMHDTTYYELSEKYFANLEITSLQSIRDGAKKFLRSSDFSNLVLSDLHLRHQSKSISLNRKYDLYVETKDLSSLPLILSKEFPKFELIKSLEFPQYNLTQELLTENFYDSELLGLVGDWYSKDFEIMNALGLAVNWQLTLNTNKSEDEMLLLINRERVNALFRQRSIVLNLKESEKIFAIDAATAERDAATAERDELTQQRDELTQQRDNLISERDASVAALRAVVNSRIWRFTNLYRKLRSRKP